MKTIRCRRCNRKLLNRASRKLGIGPFCAVMKEKERFGTVQDWVDDVAGTRKAAPSVTANIAKDSAEEPLLKALKEIAKPGFGNQGERA